MRIKPGRTAFQRGKAGRFRRPYRDVRRLVGAQTKYAAVAGDDHDREVEARVMGNENPIAASRDRIVVWTEFA